MHRVFTPTTISLIFRRLTFTLISMRYVTVSAFMLSAHAFPSIVTEVEQASVIDLTIREMRWIIPSTPVVSFEKVTRAFD